jgi:hypothetical protein
MQDHNSFTIGQRVSVVIGPLSGAKGAIEDRVKDHLLVNLETLPPGMMLWAHVSYFELLLECNGCGLHR